MINIISKYSLSLSTLTRTTNASKLLTNRTKTTAASNIVKKHKQDDNSKNALAEYRLIYPEFLPDPRIDFRNSVREKLERMDMISRRSQIDIPEFYVGCILAVTTSDKHNPAKNHRFVGICIQRSGCGLRANFLLRNVIDNQGVEVLYEMYDPTIIRIEVLRLEKRLDDELLYLRDAPQEYSTFDPNMEIEPHMEGAPVPINTIKVKLKPRPWLERWERKNLKGVEDLGLPERFYKRAGELATPWEKYDLMKQYMKTVPEEEQNQIFAEIQSELQNIEITRKKLKRKRTFLKPSKLA
ncbi:Ribosomal protein L19 [Popillia japonica]|uniref:Large ribosomal subunit protein bL19m n=1 Tax=Popillia japonica TaxID=7064 RepID=A0AAW1HU79_POPJA